MPKLKIVLAGQKAFGAAVLADISQAGFNVLLVSCPPEPDALCIRAKMQRHPITHGGLWAAKIPEGADLIVAAHAHEYISEKCRLKTKFGAIGYHPSLLPRHRGRDAVEWTIRMKDPVAGGSVYWLNNGVDCGPVAANDWCFVSPEDTAKGLWRRELFPMGIRLINKVLSDLEQGEIIRKEQNSEFATWEPSLKGAPRLFRPDLGLLPYFNGDKSNGAVKKDSRTEPFQPILAS